MPPLQIIGNEQAPHFSINVNTRQLKAFIENCEAIAKAKNNNNPLGKFSAFMKLMIARSGVTELKTFE